MAKKFIPPYKSGYLDIGDGHKMYYECCGNPAGKPVLYLHGGPGSGFSKKDKRFFDKKVWNAIFFDQRGAGKSTPFASLQNNTTNHLVKDISKLLDFLKIRKVTLFGGSWGSTLAVIYAIQNPKRVKGMILRGIWLADCEIKHYIEGGVRQFFPEYWEQFVSLVPEKKRKKIVEYYLKKILSSDPETIGRYAYAWTFYEASITRLKPDLKKIEKELARNQLYSSLAPLEAYYIVNNCFIPEGYILKNAHKLSKIPTVIVQGRYDMVCPPIQAYKFHTALPGSKLYFVIAGHSSQDREINKKLIEETKRMADIV